MTRRITLQLAAIVSDDGTRCAAECPRFAAGQAGWQDACRWDDGYHVVTHGRTDACIAAEQAAASVPSCAGAWAIGDRVRAHCDGDEGTVVGIGTNHLVIAWDSFKADGRELMRWANYGDWSDITRLPADNHLDGGARALDASEALREARVQGMREGWALAESGGDPRDGKSWAGRFEAAIEAVRKGER